MSIKILRNSISTVFEPHLRSQRTLPFTIHLTQTQGKQVRNYHENLELLYFIEGSGTVENGETLYAVKAEDLVVVNSYAVHQVDSDRPLRYLCLIIDSDFCKYHGIDTGTLEFGRLIRDTLIPPIAGRIIQEFTGEEAFRTTAAETAVLELLLLLCRKYSQPRAPRVPMNETSLKRVQTAISYIKQNIGQKLTVEQVAAAAGVSQYHFMREFKRCTGCTVTHYISIIRCECAKELLSAKGHKVNEVAYLCGFESESYFTTVFKKHTGMLPTEYMRTWK